MPLILPPSSCHFSPIPLSSLLPGLKVYICFPFLLNLRIRYWMCSPCFLPSPSLADISLLDRPLSRPLCDLEELREATAAAGRGVGFGRQEISLGLPCGSPALWCRQPWCLGTLSCSPRPGQQEQLPALGKWWQPPWPFFSSFQMDLQHFISCSESLLEVPSVVSVLLTKTLDEAEPGGSIPSGKPFKGFIPYEIQFWKMRKWTWDGDPMVGVSGMSFLGVGWVTTGSDWGAWPWGEEEIDQRETSQPGDSIPNTFSFSLVLDCPLLVWRKQQELLFPVYSEGNWGTKRPEMG